MPDVLSYRDLHCWQRAIDLALIVYEITGRYPSDERFGLTSHTRKSAVSVPSNIAEGSRHKTAGYVSRLVIALGEHAELETQVILAQRLGYVSSDDMRRFETLATSVGQLTHGVLRSLEPGS